MRRVRSALVALSSCLLMGSFAGATPLIAGGSVPAAGELDPVGGTVIASLIAAPFVAGTFSGTLTSRVISGDTSNLLGGLTFTYQFTNTSGLGGGSIDRLTILSFLGSSTDVSYQIPPALGAALPLTIDRSALGDVIGFDFGLVPSVSPGETTALLVVQTNSPLFASAVANLINGSVTTAPTFAPIPEPASAALIAFGLVGIAVRRRRAR